ALLAAMWPMTAIAPLARLLSGHRCRVIASEHGMLSAQYRDWGRLHRLLLRSSAALGYRLCDARGGVSQGVAADMASLSGMSLERFHVIHNPVPERRAASQTRLGEAEAMWGTGRGGRILSVGRFKPVKNHALLLRAFARIPGNARLMLLGNG